MSDLDLVFAFHFSPLWMSEAALLFWNSMDSIPADTVLKRMPLDLQKLFPIYHVCPKCLATLLCGLAFYRTAKHSFRNWMRWEWHWLTGNVGISTADRFSILKVSWIIHAITCILQFLYLACKFQDSVLILALVSKVELWNFFNSSISLRLLLWASRNSEFCCNNCAWRSCWSRRWSSSAWAQWSSSCWDSIVSLNFYTSSVIISLEFVFLNLRLTFGEDLLFLSVLKSSNLCVSNV